MHVYIIKTNKNFVHFSVNPPYLHVCVCARARACVCAHVKKQLTCTKVNKKIQHIHKRTNCNKYITRKRKSDPEDKMMSVEETRND